MRRTAARLSVAFALLIPAVGYSQDAAARTVRPIGSVTSYLLSNSHPFFGDGRRGWAEVSATGGASLTTGRPTLELVGLAVRTLGTDPYGTASTAVAGTGPTDIGRALAASGLGNPFAGLNSGAVPVGARGSLDAILATGLVF